MALVAGTRLGVYNILAPIGAGGMGEVYCARDTKLNREVAIKVLPEALAGDPDRMARFEREAQVLAALNHPNIAAIYGVEDRALVMELVEGPSLAERIAQKSIQLEDALPIARQIAEALEYAHEKGIIHRDLKPANVKLTADGRVKVLDFGLAKALANDSAGEDPTVSPTLTMRATVAGVIMGTAGYMSPEQARGMAVDRRADVWSFGVVLYEMLTGRQMFAGETVSDTLAAVLKTDPDWSALPAETPAAIQRLLRRCLERDPRQRLRDIGEARVALSTPEQDGAPVAAITPRGLGYWWAGFAIVFGIIAAGISTVHFRELPPERLPVRFQIPPPEGTKFGGSAMALSPDGRQLAFNAINKQGRQMLWIRALDSLVAREIPGTEGAVLFFWSPDSRFVGFYSAGKLKRVEVGGAYGSGPVQTLTTTTGGGASWNSDGVIIFGGPAVGLFRVAQGGGIPSLLIKPEEFFAGGELSSLRPWFLPDGNHFLYFGQHGLEDSGIYLTSLNGKGRKRLALSTQGGVYAPPVTPAKTGYLLYLRNTTLLAQPLNPVSFDPFGEALPVADQVGHNRAMGLFSVSNNGVLAYRVGGSTLQITWFDREGKTLGTVGPPGDYTDLALSPDGKRVAVSNRLETNRDIWLMDVARGVPTRFTFDTAVEEYPVWSPDGAEIAFTSLRHGAADLFWKGSANTGSEQPLLKNSLQKRAFDWSADGRSLIYSVLDPKTKFDLWVLPMDGEKKPIPFLTGPYNETQAQFSPTPRGAPRWVAYSSDESGRYEIYVQTFPAPTQQYQISTDGGEEPRWRYDGKELYYLAPDGRLMAAEIKTAPQFEVGSPKPLFQIRTYARGPNQKDFRWALAPDGQRFLAISEPDASAEAPITVVLNWQTALKQ